MCNIYKEKISTCDKCFKLIIKQFIIKEIDEKLNENKYKVLFDIKEEEVEEKSSIKIDNKSTWLEHLN